MRRSSYMGSSIVCYTCVYITQRRTGADGGGTRVWSPTYLLHLEPIHIAEHSRQLQHRLWNDNG